LAAFESNGCLKECHPMSKVLIGAVLLLVLAGCGNSDNASDRKPAAANAAAGQPSTARPPEGPILGLMVAASMDVKGDLVGQTFTFAPDQPQITVIARIGKVAEGSSIRFAWYQETDGEDKPLFEHTVKVAEFDRAYSEGKNRGTLAAGRYRVIATLDGKTREIEFAVAPRSAKSPPRSVSGGKSDWLSLFGVRGASAQGIPTTSNQAAQAVPPGPPIAGASGSDKCCDWNGEGAPKELLGEDGSKLHDGSIDRTGPFVDVIVRGSKLFHLWYLRMTVDNKSFDVHDILGMAAETQYEVHAYVTPCDYWGSDLPGAKISVAATYNSGTQDSIDLTGVITLGDDTLAPSLHVDSTPPKKTKVKPGQKIDITVTATENRWVNGPWQTGVRS